MDAPEPYARWIIDATDRAGVGVVIAHLAPPKILYANATAVSLYGLALDELRARSPFDFVAPEQRERIAERLRQRLAGDTPPPAELTIVRSDGTRVDVEARMVDLVVDGRPAVVALIASAERTVNLAADARYRELVDAAPDGVTITRGPRFLYANKAAVDLAGCATFEEFSRYSMSDLLSPDDLRVFAERTAAMVRDGIRYPPRDYVVHGRDRDRVVEISSMSIDFEGGPAVLAFVRDVTETRRAQLELERAQRLSALGTLVAGVAHEVSNPLSYASLGAELLERFFKGGCHDLALGRDALSKVAAGLERVASLVRDLRGFIRPDERAHVATALSEVIDAALKMTAPALRGRAGVDVELAALPTIAAFPGRLHQVFVNLLLNAAQSFVADDPRTNVVRVRASRSDREVAIAVSDNGRGIRAEDLPRVFDPFFTTKPAGEGTGLGLSICHTIVSQHGGRIEIASALEHGTTVTVTLPVEDARLEPRGDPLGIRGPAQRSRILVVDDEAALGSVLRDMLAPPHDVTVASGGVEAEALLLNGDAAFDVIICDLAMPDMPGAELFERVCARRPELSRSFVFMTGGVFPDAFLERCGSGAVPRLEKPFSAAQVVTVIERVLERAKTEGVFDST